MISAKEGAMIQMFSLKSLMTLTVALAAVFSLSGCGSGRLKARQDQREKMVSSTGLYCEWVNGEKHTDFDVELNLQMAKRCDSTRPFTIMPYKNVSDQNGILYCCSAAGFESASGTSPRRAAGPTARRVVPSQTAPSQSVPPAAPNPQATAAQIPAPMPTLTPSPAPQAAPADAAPAVNDDIVEDK
jgi:predicted component of type VI protein secretion system